MTKLKNSKHDIDLSINFAGIKLKNPVFTASGTCGYGDELADFMDVNALGGFITKSITLKPRKGNPTPRIIETDAGMLNAIGLANIGLERFIAEKMPMIERLSVPVFVNAAGQTIDEYVAVAQKLSEQNALAGIELNISCPNVKEGGITFGKEPSQVEKITKAVKKAAGKKTLIVKLTPTVTDISETARAAINGGANALSLVNTFTAMVIDIESRRPVLANGTGGLSGPAIKPMAVYMVHKVYSEVCKAAGIPILGLGGITTASDAVEFIIAGATAVAIGTATFAQPDCALKIISGIKDYLLRHNMSCATDLIGSLGTRAF